MTGFSDITPAELREMLRSHALVIGPGEVLVLTLSDSFTPLQIREINDGLNAVLYEHHITAVAVPATAASVASVPEVEGVTTGMSDATRYGSLAFSLNALIDEGGTLDMTETYAHLEDGTLFGWLGDRYRAGLNLSLYEPVDLAAVVTRFGSLYCAANPRRVYGVHSNGLSLLLAFCLEALCDVQSEPGPAREPRTG